MNTIAAMGQCVDLSRDRFPGFPCERAMLVSLIKHINGRMSEGGNTLIGTLSEKDLVARSTDASLLRKIMLVLTDAGREWLERIPPVVSRLLDYHPLTGEPDSLQELVRLSKKLLHRAVDPD